METADYADYVSFKSVYHLFRLLNKKSNYIHAFSSLRVKINP